MARLRYINYAVLLMWFDEVIYFFSIFQIGKAEDLASIWDLPTYFVITYLLKNQLALNQKIYLVFKKLQTMGTNLFLFLFVHIQFFIKVCSVSYATKGQLLSKYLFGVFISPKKWTKRNPLEVPTIAVKFIFWGRIEDTKKTFWD